MMLLEAYTSIQVANNRRGSKPTILVVSSNQPRFLDTLARPSLPDQGLIVQRMSLYLGMSVFRLRGVFSQFCA